MRLYFFPSFGRFYAFQYLLASNSQAQVPRSYSHAARCFSSSFPMPSLHLPGLQPLSPGWLLSAQARRCRVLQPVRSGAFRERPSVSSTQQRVRNQQDDARYQEHLGRSGTGGACQAGVAVFEWDQGGFGAEEETAGGKGGCCGDGIEWEWECKRGDGGGGWGVLMELVWMGRGRVRWRRCRYSICSCPVGIYDYFHYWTGLIPVFLHDGDCRWDRCLKIVTPFWEGRDSDVWISIGGAVFFACFLFLALSDIRAFLICPALSIAPGG